MAVIKQIFANNASALLAASINDTDLTIQVDSGYGALFPNPGANEYFIASLENALGDIEYVKVITRVGDLLTVEGGGRGYDGSSAQAWTNGVTRVENRETKALLEVFLQRGGGTMDGDLDMNDHEVKDAKLTGATVITGGQSVGMAVRGALDDASNELAVPDDGSPATAGASIILTAANTEGVKTAAFEVGQIIIWYGAAASCPAGWKVCDGSSGTPDMRDFFPIGASGTKALGTTGGAASANIAASNTGAAGSHTHATTSGAHALTEAEMPAHNHTFLMSVGNQANGSGTHYDMVGATQHDTVPSGPASGQQIIGDAGGGGTHTHPGGTTDNPGNHTHSTPGAAVATVPPYRAVHFIIFVGF
jgi:hypothetical protein